MSRRKIVMRKMREAKKQRALDRARVRGAAMAEVGKAFPLCDTSSWPDGAMLSAPGPLTLIVKMTHPTDGEVQEFRSLEGYAFYSSTQLPQGLLLWRFAGDLVHETPFNPRAEETVHQEGMRLLLGGEANLLVRYLVDEKGILRAICASGLDRDFVKGLASHWASEAVDWSDYERRCQELMSAATTAQIWTDAPGKWRHSPDGASGSGQRASGPCEEAGPASGNPSLGFTTYESIVEDIRSGRVGPGDLLHVVVPREMIESCCPDALVGLLSRLAADRSTLERGWGKLFLTVFGYDGDAREVYEIPEVVRFFRQVDARCPYWLCLLQLEKASLAGSLPLMLLDQRQPMQRGSFTNRCFLAKREVVAMLKRKVSAAMGQAELVGLNTPAVASFAGDIGRFFGIEEPLGAAGKESGEDTRLVAHVTLNTGHCVRVGLPGPEPLGMADIDGRLTGGAGLVWWKGKPYKVRITGSSMDGFDFEIHPLTAASPVVLGRLQEPSGYAPSKWRGLCRKHEQLFGIPALAEMPKPPWLGVLITPEASHIPPHELGDIAALEQTLAAVWRRSMGRAAKQDCEEGGDM